MFSSKVGIAAILFKSRGLLFVLGPLSLDRINGNEDEFLGTFRPITLTVLLTAGGAFPCEEALPEEAGGDEPVLGEDGEDPCAARSAWNTSLLNLSMLTEILVFKIPPNFGPAPSKDLHCVSSLRAECHEW